MDVKIVSGFASHYRELVRQKKTSAGYILYAQREEEKEAESTGARIEGERESQARQTRGRLIFLFRLARKVYRVSKEKTFESDQAPSFGLFCLSRVAGGWRGGGAGAICKLVLFMALQTL